MTAFLSDPVRRVFFLGSRQGALACYEIASAKLVGIWRRIHNEEGVRSIQILDPANNSTSWTEILTTGRNCAYQIFKLSFPVYFKGALPRDVVSGSLEGIQMQCVHKSILNRGWLEGVLIPVLREVIRRPQLSTSTFFYGDFIPRNSHFGMKRQVN